MEDLASDPEHIGLLRLDAVGFLSHITGDGTRSFSNVADRSAIADEWFNRRAIKMISYLNKHRTGIALLYSGTDDLIAMGHAAMLGAAARLLQGDYRCSTGGELAAGLADLRPGMTEADLSRKALQRLVEARRPP